MLHQCMNICCSYEVCVSPVVSGSSVVQCFECGNMLDIYKKIIDYHTYMCVYTPLRVNYTTVYRYRTILKVPTINFNTLETSE